MVKPGAFQKGQSGNPGGRPSVAKEIKALARERTRRPLTPSRSTAEPLGADKGYIPPGSNSVAAPQQLRLVSAVFWMRRRRCPS